MFENNWKKTNFHCDLWFGINVCKSHQNGFTKNFDLFPTVSKEYNKTRTMKKSERGERINYISIHYLATIWTNWKSESIPEKGKVKTRWHSWVRVSKSNQIFTYWKRKNDKPDLNLFVPANVIGALHMVQSQKMRIFSENYQNTIRDGVSTTQ